MAAFLRRARRPSIIHDAFCTDGALNHEKGVQKEAEEFHTLEGLFTSACGKSADVQ